LGWWGGFGLLLHLRAAWQDDHQHQEARPREAGKSTTDSREEVTNWGIHERMGIENERHEAAG